MRDKFDMSIGPEDAEPRHDPLEHETICEGCSAIIDVEDSSDTYPCGCQIDDDGCRYCKQCIELLLDDGEHDKDCEGK